MVPQAQQPIVDRVVTFKLSLAAMGPYQSSGTGTADGAKRKLRRGPGA